jgi:acyl carrier protein phosphodiesterase
MNFLGHFFFSDNDPEILLGQFLGDYVKGKRYLDFETKVAKGILMHRFIDDFTDHQEDCLRLRDALRPDFGLYSPIVIDMFLDHFLARDWHHFHSQPLEDFADWCFEHLLACDLSRFPDAQTTLKYMADGRWIAHYGEKEELSKSLRGMSKRFKSAEKLALAPEWLFNNYDLTEKVFYQHLPQLKMACKVNFNTFDPV